MLQIQNYIDYSTAVANSVAIVGAVYAVFAFLKKSINVEKLIIEKFKKTILFSYLCRPNFEA